MKIISALNIACGTARTIHPIFAVCKVQITFAFKGKYKTKYFSTTMTVSSTGEYVRQKWKSEKPSPQ